MSEDLNFGQWLHQRRMAHGLNQEGLADRIGCSPETIRKIETCRRRPSLQLVEMLAQCFDVPAEEWPELKQLARGRSEDEGL